MPPKRRSSVLWIIAGSAAAFVGLVVLAVIAAGALIGDAGTGTRTIEDHDHVVSIVLPASWDVDNSPPVGTTDPNTDPADPEYLPQIDASGGFLTYSGILVYVEDPVAAADHHDWLRSEVDVECVDLPCDVRGAAVELTVAGYPAIQQMIADTKEDEQGWELVTTIRTPNRSVVITAYTDDPNTDSEATLTEQVAGLRVLR